MHLFDGWSWEGTALWADIDGAESRFPVAGEAHHQLLSLLPPLRANGHTHDDTVTTRSREAGVMRGQRSGCFAVVVPQQSAQSFAASDFAGCPAHLFPRCDQNVAEPLMVALRMKVENEFLRGISQRSLSEEDHAPEAFLLD